LLIYKENDGRSLSTYS